MKEQPGALRVARAVGMVRDLLTTIVGVGLLISTPPSLLEFSGADVAAVAWSFLPLSGGLLCLLGILRSSINLEVIGAFTVAAGFVVWSVAAVAQPDVSLVSVSVAGAFLILALNAIVRGLVVATGLLIHGGSS